MTTEADFWACSQCRSINKIRADRCYSCHAPRDVAAVRPTELSVTDTKPRPIAVTTPYRSSEGRAVIATVAGVVFILGTALSLWLLWSITNLRAEGERETADRLLTEQLPLLAVVPVLCAVGLLAYGAWISRVVENLPALGAGYSRVSPTMALIEPLIPGLNLYSLPARAGEVVQKLEGGTRGLAMIALSWLLVVAPFVVTFWVMRVSRFAGTGADFFRATGWSWLVGFAFQAAGLVLALAVIWHIEGLCRARVTTAEPSL
ncbi:MAG: hypothetical protein AB1736_13555 [Chloroflexota bacterium]